MRPTKSKLIAVTGVITALVALAETRTPAQAAFPGANGKVAFDRLLAQPGAPEGVQFDIFTMNHNGTNQTNLTNHPAMDQQPSWSPDGRRIAFASDRDGDFEIYLMNADGSGATQITFNDTGDFDPTWAPGGAWLAFVAVRDGNAEIYRMAPDGSNQVNLTETRGHDLNPNWFPDGSEIAFESDRPPHRFNHEIYTMNVGGRECGDSPDPRGSMKHRTGHPTEERSPSAANETVTPRFT